MITVKNRKAPKLIEERQAALERKRREFYPNIPPEIFVSLEDFLFFMGGYTCFFNY